MQTDPYHLSVPYQWQRYQPAYRACLQLKLFDRFYFAVFDLLQEDAEQKLATALTSIKEKVIPLLDNSEYEHALSELAGLKEDVDTFFDDVMVMCEDEAVKNNRLALLNQLSNLFLKTADISKLQN